MDLRSPGGGALVRIRPGFLGERWPGAGLRATTEQLTLSGLLIDPFVVTRTTVLSITPVDWAPALSRACGSRSATTTRPPCSGRSGAR
ncbi:hypothetical protein [Actinoplanes awajinensis]|uniref:hypothetical protein n=1 Tax=Actinoplanes awajinensis TaxID=135946 RepID=UPI000A9EA9EC|nr:hypothetical protein [Actinoplanes awajinensis]